MKREIVFFRALLLLFVASFLGFGTLAIYYERKASFWGESMVFKGNESLNARSRCEQDHLKGIVQPFSCKMVEEWKEAKEEARAITYFFSDKSDLFTTLALAVPLFCMFAFYGGRWAVSGRVKPLWPFKDSSQS